MESTRCSVQRVDRECNLIQINKMGWVYALGLAVSQAPNHRHVDSASRPTGSHASESQHRPIVTDQLRTLSQVGTSSYMTYAMQELTQRVPIWLKKFLLGPIVN